MKSVTIYTDGSAWRGYGGAAAVLIGRRRTKEVARGFGGKLSVDSILNDMTGAVTNQQMELMAAILGLGVLKEPAHVKVISDSAYLVNCFREGWIEKWQENGWLNSANQPVANRGLWVTLHVQVSAHEVVFEHVRGHNGDFYNERVDALARAARLQAMREGARDAPKIARDALGTKLGVVAGFGR